MRPLKATLASVLLFAAACSGAAPVAKTVPTEKTEPRTVVTPSPRPRVLVHRRRVVSSPAKVAGIQTSRILSGRFAWIAVSVATVWGSTTAPHSVDRPALENPARIRAWLSGMSTSQRRSLGPTRVNTQAVLGERVYVEKITGSWAHIAVPAQKSPWDARGYPGWVPLRQLRQTSPPRDAKIATVVAKFTTLRTSNGQAALEISYATRLPVVHRHPNAVDVWMPDGRTLVARASDVVVSNAASPARPRTTASIIADAKRFLGLPYLWDGTSAYGFDCSGITYSVFRTHGILLPRDSFGQVKAGTAVSRSHLKPGDLVFLAANGKVHHVGMYIGDNKILHAPKTGDVVRIVTMSGQWNSEYAGARRFIP